MVLELAGIGKMIEAHYDRPMDIEWCNECGNFYIVQARPITTLAVSRTIGSNIISSTKQEDEMVIEER